MHPTKKTGIKRTKSTKVARKPRKVEVKRAYDSKSVVGRLLKLKYRINDAYKNQYDLDNKDDRNWVLGIIEESKDGINPNQQHLLKANELWKKYSDMDYTSSVEGEMWEKIDELLDANKKINAIKVYRKWMNCDLREAKDVIDARKEKLNRGW